MSVIYMEKKQTFKNTSNHSRKDYKKESHGEASFKHKGKRDERFGREQRSNGEERYSKDDRRLSSKYAKGNGKPSRKPFEGPKPFHDRSEYRALLGQIVKVKCKELDDSGKGVAFYQGLQLHIPNFLPDEEADVEFVKRERRIEPRVKRLLTKSPIRVKCRCDVFENCGGCQYQHISYYDQLKLKDEYVANKFKEIRGKYTIHPIIGMDDFDHYRCKNQAVYGVNKNGSIISGFYEEDTHHIVNYEDCMIQDLTANKIMKTIKKLMLKYNVVPYNEDSEEGLLRHVFIRVGKHSKQVLVALVTAGEMFPGRKDFTRDLLREHPEITTIIQSINSYDTNMVLGDKERVLYGDGYITDTLCGLTFQISATSFYQVNPIQTEHLYSKAIEYAHISKDDVVLDAYSGIGTIGLIAAKHCKEVISVEVNTAAFKDAIKNSKINKIKNVDFYNNDATEFMMDLAEENVHIDVLIMDPPRSGSTEEFLYAVSKLQPKTVVYVSCNVDTQVRDIKNLVKAGYFISEVQPVDMFPSTKHVESVVLLSRK